MLSSMLQEPGWLWFLLSNPTAYAVIFVTSASLCRPFSFRLLLNFWYSLSLGGENMAEVHGNYLGSRPANLLKIALLVDEFFISGTTILGELVFA